MIDDYGRNINYLRISLTELCNLRCKYCMPEEGVPKKQHGDMFTWEEYLSAIRGAISLGITKVRLTGGEPLVKYGIVDLCREIAALPGLEEVCLTTNGTLLPKYAKGLKEAGVDRLNISLDTLNPERYKEITRLGNLEDALAGIQAAKEAGFENIKINVVLIKGFNDDEVEDFVELTRDEDIEVRFIELMPIGDGIDRGEYMSGEEVLEMVPQLVSLEKTDGVATLYALPGAKGRVGLIKPISCDFCEDCNKIRLTADGNLIPCLHSSEEVPLKGLDEDEMVEKMRETILRKPEKRQALDGEHPSQAGRNMNQIGG